MTPGAAVPATSSPLRRHDRLLSITLALALCGSCGRAYGLERFQDACEIMGTLVTVIVFAPDESSGSEALEKAFGEIKSVEDLMSTWREDTELSRLNASAGGPPAAVSEALFEVLARSMEISALTGGAFDVTVRPLVEVWKAAGKRNALPTEPELARARKRVGYERVLLDSENRTVTLPKGMGIDLGAIAKGYAVDRAARALRVLGIGAFLIEAGGDLFAAGQVPDTPARPWSIGVQDPFDTETGRLIRGLAMADRAAATSGHYYRSVTIRGVKYSHIIDPRTGRPVEHIAASVTVIAPSCMDADALATALSVLGADRAEDLLSEMNAGLAEEPFAAFIIKGDEDRPTFTRTTAFPQYDIPPRTNTTQPWADSPTSRTRFRWLAAAVVVLAAATAVIRLHKRRAPPHSS